MEKFCRICSNNLSEKQIKRKRIYCSRACQIKSLRKEITGKKFGRLIAIKRVGVNKSDGCSIWLFQCDCGNQHTTSIKCVLSKKRPTKSCGCLQKEWAKKIGGESHKWNTKHGFEGNRFYKVFGPIKERCNNPNSKNFPRYGGRGIKCLWNSFEEFRDDMYEPYLEHIKEFGEGKNTTIDRINNNGHYSKENCRWATMEEQGNNRRNNVFIEYNGKKRTVSIWARFLNMPEGTIRNRLTKGLPIEKIFSKTRYE